MDDSESIDLADVPAYIDNLRARVAALEAERDALRERLAAEVERVRRARHYAVKTTQDGSTVLCIDQAIAAAEGRGEKPSCLWTEDEDGCWPTACGHVHAFTEGGPAENDARYCCYCGRGLVEEKCGEERP